MLIVAQPKTASSSLLASLGDVLGWPAVQDFIRTELHVWPAFQKDLVFPQLGYMHSDAVDTLDADRVAKWAAPGYIFKQHVLPTLHNLHILKDTPIVLLTREPEAATQAYLRSMGPSHIKLHTQFIPDLITEMQIFYDTWKAWSDLSRTTVLNVTYMEVTNEPIETIQRIGDFWHLDLPEFVEGFELAKKRYSRDHIKREDAKKKKAVEKLKRRRKKGRR